MATTISALGSRQTIAVGAVSNDGTGDTLKAGAVKINQNFQDVYEAITNINALATTTSIGVVSVDDNTMNVTNGKISVNTATTTVLGAVKTGTETATGIKISSGLISTSAAIIPYAPKVTGIESRTIANKLDDIISIFDFLTTTQIAAVIAGTNAPDVTTEVIQAIEAGPVSVFFPAGSYKITSTITVSSKISLIGEGAGTSILYWQPSTADLDNVMFNITTQARVYMSQLRLVGPYTTTPTTISGTTYNAYQSKCTGGAAIGFSFQLRTNTTGPYVSMYNFFENLLIENFYTGIRLWNQMQATVNNCKFINNKVSGLNISFPYGYTTTTATTPVLYKEDTFLRLLITNNVFEYTWGMDTTPDTKTSPVRVVGASPFGIFNSSGGGIVISNNFFVNIHIGFYQKLDRLDTSDTLKTPYSFIFNNNVIQNGNYGFVSQTPGANIRGQFYSIVGNNFSQQAKEAIQLTHGTTLDMSHVNISSNSIELYSPDAKGIYTKYVSQLAIFGNSITGTKSETDTQIGIWFDEGTFDFTYNNNFFTQINTNVKKATTIADKNGQSAIIAKKSNLTSTSGTLGTFTNAVTIPGGRFDANAIIRIRGLIGTSNTSAKTISVKYGTTVIASGTFTPASNVTSLFEFIVTINDAGSASTGYGILNGIPDNTPTTATVDYNNQAELSFSFTTATAEAPTIKYYTVEIIS